MKKIRERFSIKFNLADPVHRHAIEILEGQGMRNKANYIANAVLYYEGATETQTIGDGFRVIQKEGENHVRNMLDPGKSMLSNPKRSKGPTQAEAVQDVPIGESERSLILKSLTDFGCQ